MAAVIGTQPQVGGRILVESSARPAAVDASVGNRSSWMPPLAPAVPMPRSARAARRIGRHRPYRRLGWHRPSRCVRRHRSSRASVGTGRPDASLGTGRPGRLGRHRPSRASVGTGRPDASVGTGRHRMHPSAPVDPTPRLAPAVLTHPGHRPSRASVGTGRTRRFARHRSSRRLRWHRPSRRLARHRPYRRSRWHRPSRRLARHRSTDASLGTGRPDASVGTGRPDASVGTGRHRRLRRHRPSRTPRLAPAVLTRPSAPADRRLALAPVVPSLPRHRPS